jgi:hypothetical protein
MGDKEDLEIERGKTSKIGNHKERKKIGRQRELRGI